MTAPFTTTISGHRFEFTEAHLPGRYRIRCLTCGCRSRATSTPSRYVLDHLRSKP